MIAVILTAVLDIAGEYYEFKAHAGVMSYVSQMMSDKWERLWNGNYGRCLACWLP